jgi:hypothetical protein
MLPQQVQKLALQPGTFVGGRTHDDMPPAIGFEFEGKVLE